jgi:hypothetical protein
MDSSRHSTLLHIVSCPDGTRRENQYTLDELLHNLITSSPTGSSVIVEGQREKLLLVCALPTADESSWSTLDAVNQMEKVVLAGNVPTGTAFLFRATSGSTFAITISTFVATSAKALASVELDTDEAEDGTANCTWLPWSKSRREYNKLYHEEEGGPPRLSPERRLVRYLAAFLLAVALLSSSALFLPVKHPWQRFIEVIGSNGPQYQLQLKPDNVSQWVKEQGNEIDSKWFLRIDDGAIYPKSLLTDAEVEYQSWLSERYPEVDTVKSEHLFLDEDYLAQPRAPDMLIDRYFHISHCVHSMRRYWVAKETGSHICPMDLSAWHMKHCFENILLPWALPSGTRGTVPEGFDDTIPYNISWVTRVCF